MHGWMGTILFLDLSLKSFLKHRPLEDFYFEWIGGRGLAGALFHRSASFPWNHPSSPLIFMTGPLTGTAAPTSGRMCVMARSPLTGTAGDSSVGGKFGLLLKKAGFDGIVVTGRAEDGSVGIVVSEHGAEFVDAKAFDDITSTREGFDMVRRIVGGRNFSAALTGPAALNGVRFASIMFDGSYTAGRNGLGLVFASRGLRFIAVKGGGGKRVSVASPKLLKHAREDILRLTATAPVLHGEFGISRFGTGSLYDLIHTRRMMPTANFRRTIFEYAPGMNAPVYINSYSPVSDGCAGCDIRCKKRISGNRHLPEFETMAHFSALVENEDTETVVKANDMCNALGMDTISAASTLACYSELKRKKLSPDEITDLLTEIGTGNTLRGATLGEGSARYAASMGRPDISMSVKGQELPAYDPRGAYGMALSYVTSTRGGCHLRAYPISHEILCKPVCTDRFTFTGKARIIKIAEDLNAVVDSLTACKFTFFAATLEEYAEAFTAVTGHHVTAQDLLDRGERIYYRERIVNHFHGLTSIDDDLPPRFFNEPGSSGQGIDIPPIDRNAFLEARRNYYTIRGLDRTGSPTSLMIRNLGLKKFSKDMVDDGS